jgi:hypothetical protein
MSRRTSRELSELRSRYGRLDKDRATREERLTRTSEQPGAIFSQEEDRAQECRVVMDTVMLMQGIKKLSKCRVTTGIVKMGA